MITFFGIIIKEKLDALGIPVFVFEYYVFETIPIEFQLNN
ncbi:hypothetical protein B4077_3189 [Bacillus cereus]|uniref:Uncharacterized protein n=1 Tax=Bacillus cereus TaxID=1396 RepID=A0A0G8EDB0_BACCE|nr:hypothetical protein B4077_3189 [Bacillus cereus]